jgi:hypothetical protein
MGVNQPNAQRGAVKATGRDFQGNRAMHRNPAKTESARATRPRGSDQCWLDTQNIADAWDLAPVLVSARIDQGVLDVLKHTVPTQDLENAIRWLVAEVTTRDLLKSITHSTERISELVQAVKSYSFMDQAPWQEIEVHEGIENTLIILGHKLKNVTVTRDF